MIYDITSPYAKTLGAVSNYGTVTLKPGVDRAKLSLTLLIMLRRTGRPTSKAVYDLLKCSAPQATAIITPRMQGWPPLKFFTDTSSEPAFLAPLDWPTSVFIILMFLIDHVPTSTDLEFSAIERGFWILRGVEVNPIVYAWDNKIGRIRILKPAHARAVVEDCNHGNKPNVPWREED